MEQNIPIEIRITKKPHGKLTLTPGNWYIRSPWGSVKVSISETAEIDLQKLPWKCEDNLPDSVTFSEVNFRDRVIARRER